MCTAEQGLEVVVKVFDLRSVAYPLGQLSTRVADRSQVGTQHPLSVRHHEAFFGDERQADANPETD
ncbi:MAG: hypothetical protein EA381_08290 [Planctomycetaceae bacterium]|nr:MAG: hypothetical protein EA381_08290 [Planctomycetaceae bacterium]